MRVALEELTLKYRHKCQDCLNLEKKVALLEADNEVVKGEVTELTRANNELQKKVESLKEVNEKNFL